MGSATPDGWRFRGRIGKFTDNRSLDPPYEELLRDILPLEQPDRQANRSKQPNTQANQ
jgi:hypothetical protein